MAPVVLLDKNPVPSHIKEKEDRIVTNRTYQWSLVTKIFRNVLKPRHDGGSIIFEVITSTTSNHWFRG